MKKYVGKIALMGLCISIPWLSWGQSISFAKAPIQIGTKLLSPFGEARGGYLHEGVDVDVPMLTPLYAVESGIITKAAPDSKGVENGGGHMVFIDHGNGVESRYMHLSLYAVDLGDQVKAGDLIGFSGASGDATKPILHYELRLNNVPIDPSFIFEENNLLDKDGQVVDTLTQSFLAPQT